MVKIESLQELEGSVNYNQSEEKLRIQHLARTPEGFRLQYGGAMEDVTVRTPTQFALAQYMKVRSGHTSLLLRIVEPPLRPLQPKKARDVSRTLVSPMPGMLVSLAVKAGDKVEAGQASAPFSMLAHVPRRLTGSCLPRRRLP